MIELSAADAYRLARTRWVEENPFRAWRKRRGIAAKHLAPTLRVTANTLQNWDMGLVRPRPRNMSVMAEQMGVTQVELEAAWDRWMDRCPKPPGGR